MTHVTRRPRTGISSGTLRSVIKYGLPLPFFKQRIELTLRDSLFAFSLRHYLPTVILIIIGIPSPTHSFTLGLNPSFSANPLYRSLSFFSFRIHYMDFQDCLLLLLSISVFFTFFLFLHFFSCRFRAVD